MLDVSAVRSQFPALQQRQAGRPLVFLDGPGGTQVPQAVLDALVEYLTTSTANVGGPFLTSQRSDRVLREAHAAVADLLHAPDPDEIVFGQNMTSLTFQMSRALARTWKADDVVVVTRLDHDANVRPWVLAAQDAGAEVRFVEVTSEGRLDEADLERKLTGSVKLFAVTCASNAIGTMPEIARLIRRGHEAGALVYLDAVHYAPHGVIDVQAWDCDFLACSAYKFFGPHVGILWGRRRLLEQLPAYKVRPAPNALPGRWMTGTQNHEGIAGVAAAIHYLASLGAGATRRERLVAALTAIREHEMRLLRRLLEGLRQRPEWKVWGLTAEADLTQRAPTLGITHARQSAREIARSLAEQGICAWAGNFYAIELAEALGVEPQGGFLRLGLVHYNTAEEVERTLEALDRI